MQAKARISSVAEPKAIGIRHRCGAALTESVIVTVKRGAKVVARLEYGQTLLVLTDPYVLAIHLLFQIATFMDEAIGAVQARCSPHAVPVISSVAWSDA